MKLGNTWIWPVMLALAGCGGGGGGSDGGGGGGIDPRLARLDIYESQKLRVLGDPGAGVVGMALTDDAAMPTSGGVEFNGFASLRVEATTPLVLFGDASVTVTFDTELISGQMDNFFGTNSAGTVSDYSGNITVDGGTVGGAAASDLQFHYGGTLSAGSDTLVLDGTVTGSFLGTPVRAISAFDLEAVVDHNGSATDATFLVVGEATP